MNETYTIEKSINSKIDELEVAMQECEPIHCPVKHEFFPGMYVRKIFMPKGEEGKQNIVTSLIHNTIHPFFVVKGKVSVYSENDGEQLIEAPYEGRTTIGTRRVLLIHEDTIWITCHATDIQPANDSEEAKEEAAALVGEQILEKRENKLLKGRLVHNKLILTK